MELIDDLEKKTLQELAQEQKEIINLTAFWLEQRQGQAPKPKNTLEVVRLGACKGSHYFHADCLEG